ncbi:hypothetical protein St703_02870 [Sporolactobacillus terrae]|uniref:Uncharacterized protein n=1 Tax=Sporolactobacillus terrae TaxID=269673 RepID=A0A5K7WTE8_9BACL|nr:hypothetical protein St703_02870 [Sporolactobacillus terrae]
MQKALAFVETQKTTDTRKASDVSASTNELRRIVEEGKKRKFSAYDALQEAGYIKSPLDEFVL